MARWPRWVWVLLFVGLAVRLAWGLSRPADASALSALPDQLEYLQLARSLLAGEGLVLTDPRFPGPVYAYRTPGYPLFVAALGGSVPAVRVGQALLDMLTAAVVYAVARRWSPSGAGVALAAVVLNPLLIHHTSLVLTETLFTSMLTVGVALLLSPPGAGRGVRGELKWLAGAAVLAASVLVRPGAIALPLLLCVASAWARPQPLRVPPAACAVVLTLLTLLPWAYRNHRVLGTWVWTTTNAGITAYDGWNPDATGASDQGGFVAQMPHLALLSETQRNAYLLELARAFREEQPARVPGLLWAKLTRTWSPAPAAAPDRPWTQLAAAWAYAAVVWPLAVIGVLLPVKTSGPAPAARPSDAPTLSVKVLLLLPPVYFTAAALLTVGSVRYRLPAEPMLALLAGLGWVVVSRWLLEARPSMGAGSRSAASEQASRRPQGDA